MSTPFGAPDAGHDKAPPPFELTGLSAYAQLAEGRTDTDARVIVGRMGAGKTRCLMELRDRLRGDGQCDLTAIEFDLPNLTVVTRLAEELANSDTARATFWRQVWERAIVGAALSHLSEDRGGTRRTVYAEFRRILHQHGTLRELQKLLADHAWDETRQDFERRLAERSRPLCFFVDAVEENSAHAPLYWLWCQKGLVLQVLQLANNEVLSDKLRVFVAIRDQTFDEVARSYPRIAYHPQVRVLQWDAALVEDFLARKVGHLTPEYLLRERNGDGDGDLVAAWLGTSTVENGARATPPEDITRYILRHTRLIPRDIVMMGEKLALATRAARGRGQTELTGPQIRDAVSASALMSASEELSSCGLEVVWRQLAQCTSAAERRKTLPDEDMPARLTEQLGQMLTRCGQDVVSRDRLAAFDEEARERFGDIDFTDLLWRHGLIGWGDDETGPFTFSLGRRVLHPPDGAYAAMHPMLIDLLGVQPASAVPVVPF